MYIIILKFIQTNCDGFTSKKESFDDIVKDENPDIIAINDTALKGTVVANYLKPNTVKVAEGKEGDE